MRPVFLVAILALVATVAPAARPSGWRDVATAADRARLRDWRQTWMRALASAWRAGHGQEIAAAGALFRPDAALADPAPPPGDYRCRVTKLGAQRTGMLDFVAYPAFACRVAREDGALTFAKLTGSQRQVGRLYPDEQRRLVFLGAMALSDELGAQPYGRDSERDMVGLVERIGPTRWRLSFPRPRWESLLDVVELVPETTR